MHAGMGVLAAMLEEDRTQAVRSSLRARSRPLDLLREQPALDGERIDTFDIDQIVVLLVRRISGRASIGPPPQEIDDVQLARLVPLSVNRAWCSCIAMGRCYVPCRRWVGTVASPFACLAPFEALWLERDER